MGRRGGILSARGPSAKWSWNSGAKSPLDSLISGTLRHHRLSLPVPGSTHSRLS